MRLKDVDQKFSSDLGEFWQDNVDEYDQVENDYNLSKEQQLQYLHNLVRKDAYRYYLVNLKPKSMTYDEAIQMIEK